MVAEYLDKNYDRVWFIRVLFSCLSFYGFGLKMKYFNSYTTLMLSNNYVTKRQSLKLLGEILLDRANFNIMTRYIAQESNLKMMMNMLRDKSKNIQFEAFHVFKVRCHLIPGANDNQPSWYRSSWRTRKSHLKSKGYCEGIRRNCWFSWRISIMTRRMNNLAWVVLPVCLM